MPDSVGQILLWPIEMTPENWLRCDGQIISENEYLELFELMGFNYGSQGRSFPALPDLRGRRPIGGQPGQGEVNASGGGGNPGFLGTNFILCAKGSTGLRDSGTLPSTVLPWPSEMIPEGWLKCDGQLLPIAGNEMLFSLLGTIYGGDGRTNFALPDLRKRVPIGAGQREGSPDYLLGKSGSAKTGADKQGSTVFQYIINAEQRYPGQAGGGSPFLGMVVPWAASFAPRGWAMCHGQLLPIASNQALFALIGTTYGGDGETTFALPDLRARFPLRCRARTRPSKLRERPGRRDRRQRRQRTRLPRPRLHHRLGGGLSQRELSDSVREPRPVRTAELVRKRARPFWSCACCPFGDQPVSNWRSRSATSSGKQRVTPNRLI